MPNELLSIAIARVFNDERCLCLCLYVVSMQRKLLCDCAHHNMASTYPGVRTDVEELRAKIKILSARLVRIEEEQERLQAEKDVLETIVYDHEDAVIWERRAAVQAVVNRDRAYAEPADIPCHLRLVERVIQSVDTCWGVTRKMRDGRYIVARSRMRREHDCTDSKPAITVDPNGDVFDRDNLNRLCNVFNDPPSAWNEENWAFHN